MWIFGNPPPSLSRGGYPHPPNEARHPLPLAGEGGPPAKRWGVRVAPPARREGWRALLPSPSHRPPRCGVRRAPPSPASGRGGLRNTYMSNPMNPIFCAIDTPDPARLELLVRTTRGLIGSFPSPSPARRREGGPTAKRWGVRVAPPARWEGWRAPQPSPSHRPPRSGVRRAPPSPARGRGALS